MIYVYIAAKARVPNLFAQIQLAKAFATPFIRTTRFGYCLTTLEIALKLVIENDFQVDEEYKEEEQDTDEPVEIPTIDFDNDKAWQGRAASMSMSMRNSFNAARSDQDRSFSLDIDTEHQDFKEMSYDPDSRSRSNSIIHKPNF